MAKTLRPRMSSRALHAINEGTEDLAPSNQTKGAEEVAQLTTGLPHKHEDLVGFSTPTHIEVRCAP